MRGAARGVSPLSPAALASASKGTQFEVEHILKQLLNNRFPIISWHLLDFQLRSFSFKRKRCVLFSLTMKEYIYN
ncbi:Hypothetical predicted protein [Podarcis lilfordi]|uniref:Uncharacterized protein n=1 Tax=Podarcis lilfordi TaxID=74358 RepID=A0AA35P317_9SAUR|nr:Hypothetical predicted protein [Podarcis lilfordi]